MGLQNLVILASENFLRLQRASTELIRDMKGERKLSTDDHVWAVYQERIDSRKTQDDVNNSKLEVIVNNLGDFDSRILLRAKQSVSWMTVRGTTVTGRLLSPMELRDFLCACYNDTSP